MLIWISTIVDAARWWNTERYWSYTSKLRGDTLVQSFTDTHSEQKGHKTFKQRWARSVFRWMTTWEHHESSISATGFYNRPAEKHNHCINMQHTVATHQSRWTLRHVGQMLKKKKISFTLVNKNVVNYPNKPICKKETDANTFSIEFYKQLYLL